MGPATKAAWVKISQRLGDLARLARAAADGNEQAADELKGDCPRLPYLGFVLQVGIDTALAADEEERQEEDDGGVSVAQVAADAAGNGDGMSKGERDFLERAERTDSRGEY